MLTAKEDPNKAKDPVLTALTTHNADKFIYLFLKSSLRSMRAEVCSMYRTKRT